MQMSVSSPPVWRIQCAANTAAPVHWNMDVVSLSGCRAKRRIVCYVKPHQKA